MAQPASTAFLAGQPVNPTQTDSPPLTDLVSSGEFEIIGNENVGDSKILDVPVEGLPIVPYDWQLAYFYLYNGQGSSGRPSGSWQFQIFTDWGDGFDLAWHDATKPLDLTTRFPGDAIQRIVKPPMLWQALQKWMSGDADGGIRYGILCTAPPTLGPAILTVGVSGNIFLNT